MESTDLVERLRSKIRVYEDRMSSTATFMASRACSQDWDSVMRLSAELLAMESNLKLLKEELKSVQGV